MTRVRLREYPTDEELAAMYAVPHSHTGWADHRLRVGMSIELCRAVASAGMEVADLSCGDAAIARSLVSSHQVRTLLGDRAQGWEVHGPIEETLAQLDQADLFICSETLEHLAAPDAVLAKLRPLTKMIFVSTPLGEGCDGPVHPAAINPEHVWGWDADGFEEMMVRANWIPEITATVDPRRAGYTYAYQMGIYR